MLSSLIYTNQYSTINTKRSADVDSSLICDTATPSHNGNQSFSYQNH